jgi:hypothetical protein
VLSGLRILVPAVLLTVSACAHRGGGEVPPASSPVHVEVTNHYGLPMEVSVTGAGSTLRLGIVHPHMVGSFVIPQALLGGGSAVEFRAQPSARGPLFRSGEILLAPGEVVDFVITPVLFNSTVTIRP